MKISGKDPKAFKSARYCFQVCETALYFLFFQSLHIESKHISKLFGPIPVVVVSRLQLSYLMVVNSYDPRCAFTALRVKAKVTLCRSNEDVEHCRHPSSFPLTSTPSELLLQHLRSNLLVFENGTTLRARR